MIREAELDGDRHRRPHDLPRPARPRRDRARRAGARGEAARRDGRGGAGDRRRRPRAPASRSRSATSSATTPRSCELGQLLREGWLTTHLRHRQPARGPVPGAHPRRRRDRGPRHPRRRHAVLGRRRAADARLRGAGPAQARLARGPAVRPAALPVRRVRDAGRELADAGQAAPARRDRRGGHVRARLPDPAPDVHEVGPGPAVR